MSPGSVACRHEHHPLGCTNVPQVFQAAINCVTHVWASSLRLLVHPSFRSSSDLVCGAFHHPLSGLVCGARQHYIPHRKNDNVNGQAHPRAARRVSLTFRKVLTRSLIVSHPTPHTLALHTSHYCILHLTLWQPCASIYGTGSITLRIPHTWGTSHPCTGYLKERDGVTLNVFYALGFCK
jgi:hypothetical protein